MLYFSINIFVFLLSVFQCLKPNLKDFKIFLLLIGLFFILLVGLRGSNDEYSRIFVEAPNLLNLLDNRTIAINQGFGFAFICSLFSTIGLSSQALLFSFAFISIFIKFYHNLLPVQLTNYINWDKYNYDVSFLHPKALQQIFLSFLVLYLLHKIDRLKKFYFIINVYILSTFFIVTMSSFAILCFRTSMHFISVEPIVIILVLRCFRWHNYMLICAALFFMFISYINYVHNQALPDYILFSFN